MVQKKKKECFCLERFSLLPAAEPGPKPLEKRIVICLRGFLGEFFWLTNHNLIQERNRRKDRAKGKDKAGDEPAEDLSKSSANALAMEERGNGRRVTKRGRKIEEGCEMEEAPANPPSLTALLLEANRAP